MKFWPFPLLRNYPADPSITKVFDAFSASKKLRVLSIDAYRATVTCEIGELQFWCANKYYAYGSEGRFEAKDGVIFEWSGGMPGRASVRGMAKALASAITARVDA